MNSNSSKARAVDAPGVFSIVDSLFLSLSSTAVELSWYRLLLSTMVLPHLFPLREIQATLSTRTRCWPSPQKRRAPTPVLPPTKGTKRWRTSSEEQNGVAVLEAISRLVRPETRFAVGTRSYGFAPVERGRGYETQVPRSRKRERGRKKTSSLPTRNRLFLRGIYPLFCLAQKSVFSAPTT